MCQAFRKLTLWESCDFEETSKFGLTKQSLLHSLTRCTISRFKNEVTLCVCLQANESREEKILFWDRRLLTTQSYILKNSSDESTKPGNILNTICVSKMPAAAPNLCVQSRCHTFQSNIVPLDTAEQLKSAAVKIKYTVLVFTLSPYL